MIKMFVTSKKGGLKYRKIIYWYILVSLLVGINIYLCKNKIYESVHLSPMMYKNVNHWQINKTDQRSTMFWTPENKEITILFYTPFFGTKPWGCFPSINNYTDTCGCSISDCHISYDISYFNKSDIVLFHGRDMPDIDVLEQLNKERIKNQLWVYLIRENPFNSKPVNVIDQFFNLSMSYRYYSDIPFPYGMYREKSHIEKQYYKEINYAANKSKQIAWMVSHCGTRRDQLAHLFEKHGLQLEVGGNCSSHFKENLKCKDRACLSELKKFKFYFSAENNLCNHYITEKYWKNPFAVDAIPITLGGSNYGDPQLAIPGSFINALDFDSPLDLIDHIKAVSSNDTLYNEYFQWKKHFKIHTERNEGCSVHLCDICSKLKRGIALKKKLLRNTINRKQECATQQKFYDTWIGQS